MAHIRLQFIIFITHMHPLIFHYLLKRASLAGIEKGKFLEQVMHDGQAEGNMVWSSSESVPTAP